MGKRQRCASNSMIHMAKSHGSNPGNGQIATDPAWGAVVPEKQTFALSSAGASASETQIQGKAARRLNRAATRKMRHGFRVI